MSRRLPLALALVTSLVACRGMGPWPGRPGAFRGTTKKATGSGGDAEMLAQVRGNVPREERGNKYPPKAYWVAEPDWQAVRSLAGRMMGRKTANTVIVKVVRLDGAPNKWPDLCVYEELTVRQDALDADASTFGPARLDAIKKRGEVDCALYDQAP